MSSDPVVLAFDPGKATGYAMLNYPEGHFSSGEAEWYQVAVWFHDFMQAAADAGMEVVVVCESYIITQATIRKSRQSWSLEFIGIARYLAQRMMKRELILQSAADAKSFSTDDKLKNVGWYTPGKGHANDAARHLLLLSVRRNYIDPASVIQ